MSVPPPQHSCWQRLAQGGLARLKTQNLAIQMMTKRFERAADSPEAKAREIHAFFTKFERILTTELQQLATI